MKKHLLLLPCLALLSSSCYSMQRENSKVYFQENSLLNYIEPSTNTNLITKLDISGNRFKETTLSLSELLNSLPNLTEGNFSDNNITAVSLKKPFDKHNRLTLFDLSCNKITYLNLGLILKKCPNLKKLNLENNKTLDDINITPDPTQTTSMPVINLRNTKLKQHDQDTLIEKYIVSTERNFYNDNLHISLAGAVLGFLSMEIAITPFLFLSNNFHIIPFGSAIAIHYAINKNLRTNAVKKIKDEKLHFDD